MAGSGITLERIEQAVLMGLCAKVCFLAEQSAQAPIASLHYFEPDTGRNRSSRKSMQTTGTTYAPDSNGWKRSGRKPTEKQMRKAMKPARLP